MKKADEMFEKLGFEKVTNADGRIKYRQLYTRREIEFDEDEKRLHFEDEMCVYLDELQAIYEKCKELGWLDE